LDAAQQERWQVAEERKRMIDAALDAAAGQGPNERVRTVNSVGLRSEPTAQAR
jgi:hypothetical protein